MLLRGLQVNGQPFFARSRNLDAHRHELTPVLKLAWLVPHETVDHHFIWLLSRLARCATIKPPWTWDSHGLDSSLVHFRAWLMSPVGYGGDVRGSFYTTVRLHCFLAPEDPTNDAPPAFCPAELHACEPAVGTRDTQDAALGGRDVARGEASAVCRQCSTGGFMRRNNPCILYLFSL